MRANVVLTLGAAVLLNSCGGGVSFGFGYYDDDDFFAPAINLAASPTTVRAGESVQLIAAASDQESGVDSVAFFRIDGTDSAVRLGSDGREPFEWVVTAPNDGRTTLRVFAQARDYAGNRTDSATLTIAITP